MNTQPTLFDLPTELTGPDEADEVVRAKKELEAWLLKNPPERAKADAIAQVEANNREFVNVAYTILRYLAYAKPTVTALDVWAVASERNVPLPKHPRAIGAVFVRAHKAGLISPTTNSWVKSGRTSDHNQQLRVWRSEVYRGGGY